MSVILNNTKLKEIIKEYNEKGIYLLKENINDLESIMICETKKRYMYASSKSKSKSEYKPIFTDLEYDILVKYLLSVKNN